MTEPSSNVAPQLLRHVHLVCNKQFPVMHRPNVNTILQHLLEAPRIVRDEASMTWKTLVEPQPDGKVMLVWQSRHKTDFATDGYVWLDVEKSQLHREGRHIIEVHTQNNGYRHPTDQVTQHARRRYRLVPSQPPNPGMQVDPSLWIVHYYQTEPQNQVPITALPIPEHTKQLMQEQRIMQAHRQLQLQHNEFMLHDRNKWPSIHAPGTAAPQYPQQAMVYPNNVMAQMSRNQALGYHQYPQGAVPQASMGPSPAKRVKHGSMNHPAPSTTALSNHLESREAVNPDDESPDYMDTLMPREISALRYKQHHEWIEEVLSSPYDTYQILPQELGLGRKGELESLTRDFFEAHTDTSTGKELSEPRSPTDNDISNGTLVVDDDPPPRVGRLPEGQAEDFKLRAANYMDKVSNEMQRLRAEHLQQMEQLKGIHFWRDVDEKVRANAMSAINGKANAMDLAEVEDLIGLVERNSGLKISPLEQVKCIEKGGLEEKKARPNAEVNPEKQGQRKPQENGVTASTVQTEPIPQEQPTNEQPMQQAASTPAPVSSTLPETAASGSNEPAPAVEEAKASPTLEHGVDDWIMIDQDANGQGSTIEQAAFDSFTDDAAMQVDSKAGTPAAEMPATTDVQLGDTEFDAGMDLADFNTAGPEDSNFESIIGELKEGNPETSGNDQTPAASTG